MSKVADLHGPKREWMLAITLCGVVAVLPLLGQEERPQETKESKDPRRTQRLEFMRTAVQKMEVKSTEAGDTRDLKIKSEPLLRYSDPTREIADSAVWRLGSKGRPVALITSEVYGPSSSNTFQMNHEFLAFDQPRLTLKAANFTWAPPADNRLEFKPLKTDEKPAENAAARLNQLKRLAKQFQVGEFIDNEIQLRLLTTALDRYTPSDKPRADGALFAWVWGTNPEVLTFIETDGVAWSFAFARIGGAELWAVLGEDEVWRVPDTSISPVTPYTITVSPTAVPADVFTETKP